MGKNIRRYILAITGLLLLIIIANPLRAFAAKTKDGNWYYTVEKGKVSVSPATEKFKKGGVTIPAKVDGYTVTGIGNDAFTFCRDLTSVTLPDTITDIGVNAFWNCTALEKINLPKAVKVIGDGAFYNCVSLKKISLPDSVTYLGKRSFDSCKKLGEIILPNKLTVIMDGAFSYCSSLKKVIIPDSVTTLGEDVFFSCTSLTEVTLPDSIKILKKGLFSRCSGLKSMKLPVTLKEIGDYAFSECTGLTKIVIPGKVTKIGNSVFGQCTKLSSVSLPDSLTYIGEFAFQQCALVNINLPDSVRFIGRAAFAGCTKLTSIDLPKYLQGINVLTFSDCTSLKSVNLQNVYQIFYQAFNNCKELTSITIPDSVNYIQEGVFEDCEKLSVVFCGKDNIIARWYEYYDSPVTFIDPSIDPPEQEDINTAVRLFHDRNKVPANGKAVSAGYDRIGISWEFIGGASGYQVYRAASQNGTYSWVKNIAGTAYTDTGLTAGAAYYYKVRAFKYIGSKKVYSNYSTVVSAKPVPSVPAGVKLAKSGKNTVKISWNKVNGASGYQIYKSTSPSGTFNWVKNTTGISYNQTGLPGGKTYYYKIREFRYVGTKKVYSSFTAAVPVKL